MPTSAEQMIGLIQALARQQQQQQSAQQSIGLGGLSSQPQESGGGALGALAQGMQGYAQYLQNRPAVNYETRTPMTAGPRKSG